MQDLSVPWMLSKFPDLKLQTDRELGLTRVFVIPAQPQLDPLLKCSLG